MDVDGQEEGGFTALHLGSQSGNMETVTTIMRYNPTLLFTTTGYSAIHIAAGFNNYQVVETLVRDYGWDVDTVSRMYIICPCYYCSHLASLCKTIFFLLLNLNNSRTHSLIPE